MICDSCAYNEGTWLDPAGYRVWHCRRLGCNVTRRMMLSYGNDCDRFEDIDEVIDHDNS